MKKLYFIFCFFMICLTSKSQDFDRGHAIRLTIDFLEQLERNIPFSYDVGEKFFSATSLYSYVILFQLGYMDEQGKWLKAKPKISFICELIRLKRELILQKNSSCDIVIAGNVANIDFKHHRYFQWPIDTLITCIQKSNDKNTEEVKIIVFYYRIPQKKFDFPIWVNGTALATELGFVLNDKGIPRLRSDMLSKLQELEAQYGR